MRMDVWTTEPALQIYDGPVLATQKPMGISLTNASALLWRLEMLGFEAGNRWELWREAAECQSSLDRRTGDTLRGKN